MAVWQIVASLLAEVAVHIQVSIVSLFPRLCRVVRRFVHERPIDCPILQFKESPSRGCGFRKLRLVLQF